MDRVRSNSLDEKLVKLLDDEWQTAAQIQRICGGETLEVAKSLDRLWEAGRIEREAQEIGIGARRKGGGVQFRRIRYRQRSPQPR